MKPIYDMSWGDPLIVRQALVETLGYDFELDKVNLSRMGYTPHLGNPNLIEQLKNLAERQSGHRPKHLMVTSGATGAISAALYALKTQKTDWVVTNKRHYPFYPSIITVADMLMTHKDNVDCRTEENFISLTDSPSNPEGLVFPFETVDIWDGAYASKTYTKNGHVPEKWKIMCGSLSKTLGLAGLRLGWVSTDNDDLEQSLSVWVKANYAGLSSLSMGVAEEVLGTINLDRFETRAGNYLDDNRAEVQRLLNRFDQGNIPTRGMFAIVQLGRTEKRTLEKAGIKWQPGSSWGEDDSWARLSLGLTREATKLAIRTALK